MNLCKWFRRKFRRQEKQTDHSSGKLTIRCGLCGRTIFPGAGLACYADDCQLFPHREWITFYEKSVVGCLRTDCCPSGGFFFGNWDGQKIIPRFAGGGSATEEVFRTGASIGGNTDN